MKILFSNKTQEAVLTHFTSLILLLVVAYLRNDLLMHIQERF